MSENIESYERDIKQKMSNERAEWQLKYRKMETERMRLVCEVEERHQIIRNTEKERDSLKLKVAEIEALHRK